MRHGYYLMHGPCIHSGTTKMTMENPRIKAKHGRGEGRRRMEQDRTCPDHPDPQPDDPDQSQTIRMTTRTIWLTCPKTPEASRRSRIIRTVTRIIRTPDTRIIRATIRIIRTPPVCATWAEPMYPFAPSLYIGLLLLTLRLSVDLAQVRDRASLIHWISSS